MISITIDNDWAPENIIQNIVDILHENNIRATFFITNKNNVDYKDFELAIHPYFNLKNTAENIINELKSEVPNSIGIRSHRLITSAEYQQIFANLNFKYSSNFFLDCQKNIVPTPYMGILEIPIYFIDNLFINRYQFDTNKIRLETLELQTNGVKSFLFHPTNIFLNLENMQRQKLAKPIWKNENELRKIINKKNYGINDLFHELIYFIKKNNLETYTLKDIYNKYNCVL